MQSIKKRIWFVLVVAATALISIYIGILQLNSAAQQELVLSQPQLLEVSQGDSLHQILLRLHNQKIINRNLWLRAHIKLFQQQRNIHTGAYELMPGMALNELIQNMINGRVKQFEITLIEGQTWSVWKQIILQSLAITDDLNESTLIEELAIPGNSLEGWLLPDTYLVTWNTSATEFVRRLYQNMQEYLQSQWQQRVPLLPYNNAYEALILASIIEKETGLASERPRIAGVFVNRLEQGMRLQTDPTVIYGLGELFDGNLTRQHLRQRTAYNTYVINGLPPTPIAMPSKAAVKAALNPQTTEEVYFVAKGDGSHHFSVTLAEHNAAVRKYQLGKSE
ncbi:MAG: endolytic transglycosylase MltG [Aestuariibacter sp.]